MKLLWGDIHNHCGISYGYGSLKNALDRARSHLDFCAVTGHAMWPDIPARTPETAFVVDFHQAGFRKLREHWDTVEQTIARANDQGLVTFQAYEMHSSAYGDHHIVSPDDRLPLIYRDSPAELMRDVGVPALTVCHHIGYTPGYRGINWDKYDETITPLIEVCSKHGCAMSETAPYPYYHNMGPRDSRNTVYEGLRRGYHFGFVGSTDHHAGFPGSYGDGKMAVWAEKKDRQSIWQAMLNRCTYAVTGDRIECRFSVNGAPMGSILPENGRSRHLDFFVKGSYNIDKIVLYKNLQPLHIVEGLQMRPHSADRHYKFRIEMGWGNNTEELFRWQGSVDIRGGHLLSVEPCFRGRSVLAPSSADTDGYDAVNDMDSRLLEVSDTGARWQCFTVKNISPLHPLTNAVIFELDGTPETELSIQVNGHMRTLTVAQLMRYGYSEHMKPYHSQAFKVHPILTESQYTAQGHLTDPPSGGRDFYHMEVYQSNGSCAFVTPVYFG